MKKPTHTESVSDEQIVQAPTTIYADQHAQLAVGPYVSKLTFGIEQKPGEVPNPILTVVLPTPALLNLAHQIFQIMGNSEIQQGFQADIAAFITTFPERNAAER